ncbi:hypothetical protein C8R45DRAFT_1008364 [Mycena sanguinolenta]|nr:hypothetical protein C8R45DRAFT_1008364 [Mycena sanguinolenta]
MSNASEILNPSNPLAFLPPDAYVWDVALNLGNDYALLFKYKIRFPTIVYFLSREGGSVPGSSPVQNCNALALGYEICVVLTQTSTAMLFFLRVTAVWHRNKVVFVVFSVLWVGVLGAGISIPVGVRAAHIGPTLQCIDTVVPTYAVLLAIMPLIYDTAIFLAITYRILAHTIVADSLVARLRVFYGGVGLSTLSQALLRSGQHFYFIAVAGNVALLILLQSRLSPIYRSMFAAPILTLVNAMACLVFRRIRFGLISSDGISKAPHTSLSQDFHGTANPRSLPLHSRRTDPTSTVFELNAAYPMEVRVQKEFDKFEDGADGGQEICKPATFA